jgi:hypothetical protein
LPRPRVLATRPHGAADQHRQRGAQCDCQLGLGCPQQPGALNNHRRLSFGARNNRDTRGSGALSYPVPSTARSQPDSQSEPGRQCGVWAMPVPLVARCPSLPGAPRCPVPLVARCPSLPGAPRCPVPLVARCPSLPGAPRCPVPLVARCPQLPGAPRCLLPKRLGAPYCPVPLAAYKNKQRSAA